MYLQQHHCYTSRGAQTADMSCSVRLLLLRDTTPRVSLYFKILCIVIYICGTICFHLLKSLNHVLLYSEKLTDAISDPIVIIWGTKLKGEKKFCADTEIWKV